MPNCDFHFTVNDQYRESFSRVNFEAIAAIYFALGAAAEEFTHKALFASYKDYPYFASTSSPSSTNKEAFYLQVAGFLAEASLLIYVEDPKFIKTALDQAGFPKLASPRIAGIRLLAISDIDLILVFRRSETADTTDDTTHAKVIQTTYKDFGSAQSGFVEAVGWVGKSIDKEINQLLEEKPRSERDYPLIQLSRPQLTPWVCLPP